ncbi:hypothetical protein O6H91_19G041400 [Diphasiastrum complanatum]|uniref:Uncharacterized protein n=1 Tax=Diphasiastrum complanatum TaxID=34168 RepID=A0ACC2AUP7_DIPCM|nr:hypothetical protein O6H91_19G041400 [Diphasiastrum complanatum]
MTNKISTLVALAAIVPCLLAAEGFLATFFLSDQHAVDKESFTFPEHGLPTNSGYFPLTKSARMFYAYYEAIEPVSSLSQTPIILWLQGGPGCSSMIGNFYEFGPWRTSADLQLQRNEAPWNHRFGVLFVDNPVGSGFSIAENDEDVPTNQDQAASHLYSALLSFFESHQSFRQRPFFIAGESYAGKYVPALGHHIMKRMEESAPLLRRELRDLELKGLKRTPFRLDGLIIGNGLTDPKIQVQTHAATAYSFGLIDKQQRAHVNELAEGVVKLIEKEDWLAAYKARTNLVDWIQNASALATVLDVRRSVPYHCGEDGTEFLAPFLNRNSVKAALNAEQNAVWMPCNPRVRKIMANDTMKSVKWMVEELLPIFPVLLYQGQYDIKDGVVSSEEWMRTLTWEGSDNFFSTERTIWRVGNAIAGYWHSFKTLTHVVVLGAGHQVPADQGLNSQRMIERWIESVLGTAQS